MHYCREKMDNLYFLGGRNDEVMTIFLSFLYFSKSLCFNGLCSFVKTRVKALRSKRTLNK